MLIPIEQQELDYYKAMLQKTHEVRKLLNNEKVPLQKKVIMIKEILIFSKFSSPKDAENFVRK